MFYENVYNTSSSMERTVMFSKIAGITFDNRQVLAAKCREGMRLYLRREPHNTFDSNAVAIYMDVNAFQLGYIPKATAQSVANMMDNGVLLNCYVEQINIAPTGIIGINIRITER